jgi:hypothetical protein
MSTTLFNPVPAIAPASTPTALGPYLRLPVGSIVLIKMRGHVRTHGLDYFAPAVVLNQYDPDGQIECIVWDASAGTHYNPNYAIREVGVRGEGNERQMYEIGSNVQAVLFSPDEQSYMRLELDEMRQQIAKQNELIAEMAKTLSNRAKDTSKDAAKDAK